MTLLLQEGPPTQPSKNNPDPSSLAHRHHRHIITCYRDTGDMRHDHPNVFISAPFRGMHHLKILQHSLHPG